MNPVRAKVCSVQRKDIPQRPFFSQTNEGGIGQGPALNLRLVAPDSSAIFGSTTGSTILGGGGGGSITVAPAGPTAGPLAPGSVPTDGFGTYGTISVSPGSSSGSSGAVSYASPTTQAGYGLSPNFASAFVGRPSA